MRFLKVIFSLILVTGIVLGCGTEDIDSNENINATEQEEVQSIEVDIVISQEFGEEILAEESLEVEEGSTLLEVMAENFDIEEEDGFIHSINGVKAEDGEPYAWMFDINGEIAMVGAADYELEDGDLVEFDFQSYE